MLKRGGEEFSLVYVKIPDFSWTLVYEFTNRVMIAELKKIYLSQMLNALLFIAFIAFSSFLIAGGMSKNIQKLKKAMEKAETGDLSVQIKVKSRDEIGLLCQSFDLMVSNIRELYGRLYKMEIESKKAQINALQAQINPHFFYNTMECIDSLALSEGNQKICDIARALSSSFRYAFRGETMSTVGNELMHVEAYLKIIKIRYPDKIDLNIDIQEDIPNVEIPRITLQPVVENSIIHGILVKRGKGIINISTQKTENNEVILCISDNGKGISRKDADKLNQLLSQPSHNDTGEHIGLVNVNNRIKYYFGNCFGISVNNLEQGGAMVSIRIPWKNI